MTSHIIHSRPPCSPPLLLLCLALPTCSRHSASDDYDRFGGRETPTVLRRNSLSGGGEHSKRAVEELRQQLEITEVGTVPSTRRVCRTSHRKQNGVQHFSTGFKWCRVLITYTSDTLYHPRVMLPRKIDCDVALAQNSRGIKHFRTRLPD